MTRFPPHYGAEDEPDPERQQELAELRVEYRRDEELERNRKRKVTNQKSCIYHNSNSPNS